MDQIIDLLPINKILAFGGDYCMAVEMIYGHLVMAQQNVARLLAGRVERGLLSKREALGIAARWFYDNPKELYQLKIN
jgi:hypothetical protein